MKTDYIYNIPANRETDALVAEHIFGWHWVTGILAFNHPCLISPERYEERLDYVQNTTLHGNYIGAFPKYSDNMYDAWLIVEKMGGYQLGTHHKSDGKSGIITTHYAKFWRGMMSFSVEAETAPLAICRSALLTKLYKLE